MFIYRTNSYIGGLASKSEDFVRRTIETLLHTKFPQAHPPWLLNKHGTIMELDGYNEKLGIAFEYQGPQHTKFDKHYHATYTDYQQLLDNDRLKREILAERGIHLIVIDYKFPKQRIREYLISRIHDIASKMENDIFSRKEMKIS